MKPNPDYSNNKHLHFKTSECIKFTKEEETQTKIYWLTDKQKLVKKQKKIFLSFKTVLFRKEPKIPPENLF